MANTIKVSKIDFFRAVFIFCLITIIFSNWVPAQDKSPDPLARYRVFSLKHIPAEQGKALLEQLGIGTVSRLPNSNTLLVTASGKDFTKASAILELIDSEEKYIVQIISSASETEYFPTNKQIEKEFDAGVSIGTFDNPPSNLVPERILIDSHKDMVMAFVREEFSENIFSAIERLSTTEETSQAIPEPNISPATIEVVEVNENDEFFKKLLESLDEAEQKASKLKLAPQPSDEARRKIFKLQKETPESTISTVLKEGSEIEAVAEQTAADEQELEAFLSTLSEASSPDEPIEASAKQALEGDTKKIQPKSGVIKIRDKNGDEKTELKPLQYQEDKEG
ncbi:MAG: hypothetical protein ACYTEE_03585, partial [Planctomycetota bacterium]